MTAFLRTWLLSVLGCALLLGAVTGLLPDNGAGRVGRIGAGLVLFLALVTPWVQLAPDWLGQLAVSADTEALAALETADKSYLEQLMCRRIAEYIEAEGEQLGLSITAEVGCTWREEGLPVPERVCISGVPEEQRPALETWMAQQLELAPEQITYEEETP